MLRSSPFGYTSEKDFPSLPTSLIMHRSSSLASNLSEGIRDEIYFASYE